ncbi:MAG: hypothetical protein D4R83_02040 [Streptomycetaceae bacterium]|nr:MAG: hypothetical protein D4R83_02040 [Streptomycetaceae bacterium]
MRNRIVAIIVGSLVLASFGAASAQAELHKRAKKGAAVTPLVLPSSFDTRTVVLHMDTQSVGIHFDTSSALTHHAEDADDDGEDRDDDGEDHFKSFNTPASINGDHHSKNQKFNKKSPRKNKG